MHQMKALRIFFAILLFQTVVWVLLMVITTSSVQPDWGPVEYLEWIAGQKLAGTLNYINASLLTLVAVILFVQLYLELRGQSEHLALSGLVLIAVYGVLNLMVYSLQVTIVPALARSALSEPENHLWVVQLIQAFPGSVAGYLNGLAYSVLGVPSILFGILLNRKHLRISGWLLALSGGFSIIGLVGYHLDSPIISAGTLAGGIFFLLFLAAGWMETRRLS
jgi:Ca2+/Na+ antiporter